MPDDSEREEGRDEVADAREETKDRIETEPERSSRDRKRGVEKTGYPPEQSEPLFLAGC